jgi:hypothetical protein
LASETFGLGDGTFDGNMVNLAIIIYTWPFRFDVYVCTSDDCEYGAMGGKILGLLWGFMSLLRRWG